MGRIRYGARSADELRNRELEATSVETWANTLAVLYETDPDAVAAVLPPPLTAPARPQVRITFASVDIGRGRPPFGAGTFAVAAVHEGTEGWYPLVMPMTTEQAVIGGRETFGEPKKLGDVVLERDGDRVRGAFSRLGVTFVEVTGTVSGEITPPDEVHKVDFYLKFLLDPAGKGFDNDPWLVYCHRTEKARSVWAVDGEVTLRDSPFDPVADLPVQNLLSIELAEKASSQRGELVATVSGDLIRPFVHQRYDDLSVIGKHD